MITATVAPSESDGTQSFTIPLFTGADQVVVVETENGLQAGTGTILAIGETDVQQNYIGGALTLNLTMQQNVTYIGLMTTPTGTNAAVGPVFSPQQCVSQGTQLTVFPFATDPAGGFAINSGVGGSAVPSLVTFTDPGQSGTGPNYGNGVNFDTVNASSSGSLTGYTVTYTSSAGEAGLDVYFPADLNLSVPNAVALDGQPAHRHDRGDAERKRLLAASLRRTRASAGGSRPRRRRAPRALR